MNLINKQNLCKLSDPNDERLLFVNAIRRLPIDLFLNRWHVPALFLFEKYVDSSKLITSRALWIVKLLTGFLYLLCNFLIKLNRNIQYSMTPTTVALAWIHLIIRFVNYKRHWQTSDAFSAKERFCFSFCFKYRNADVRPFKSFEKLNQQFW